MRAGGVAYVILGALRAEPKSGYEIKRLVDKATRFFWAASYGQIYPELRRLRDEGLIEALADGGGGRRPRDEALDRVDRAGLRDAPAADTGGVGSRDRRGAGCGRAAPRRLADDRRRADEQTRLEAREGRPRHRVSGPPPPPDDRRDRRPFRPLPGRRAALPRRRRAPRATR